MRGSSERSGRQQRPARYSLLLIIGIPLLLLLAFYSLLIVAVRASRVLFPGNGINIGVNLPGIPSGNPEYADINQRINILVMGLDLRPDDPPGTTTRTDSMGIITIDPFSKTAGMLSIPRDLRVDIPDVNGGYVQDRINTAYERGQGLLNGGKPYGGGGPAVAKATIEHNFPGIHINNYVVLNWQAFKDVIDELGGIDVNVPERVYDSSYNDCETCPYYSVDFEPGMQHMNGTRALAYVRLRHSDSDFKRMERQQLVLKTAMKKAAALNWLRPDKALSLYGEYKSAIDTDISDFELPGLAVLGKQINLDQLHMVSVADATYPCPPRICGDADELLADMNKVQQLESEVFNSAPVQSEHAVVELQNAVGTPLLATNFSRFLATKGMGPDQVKIADTARGADPNTTLVVDLTGKTSTANQLAQWLSLPQSSIIGPNDPGAAPFLSSKADIVVVLGSDVHAPPG